MDRFHRAWMYGGHGTPGSVGQPAAHMPFFAVEWAFASKRSSSIARVRVREESLRAVLRSYRRMACAAGSRFSQGGAFGHRVGDQLRQASGER